MVKISVANDSWTFAYLVVVRHVPYESTMSDTSKNDSDCFPRMFYDQQDAFCWVPVPKGFKNKEALISSGGREVGGGEVGIGLRKWA